MKTISLDLELPDDDTAIIPSIRRSSHLLMTQAGVPELECGEMELILGELCTNVVLHAHSPGGHFTVTLHCGPLSDAQQGTRVGHPEGTWDGSVGLCVRDFGDGFDCEHPPLPGIVEQVMENGLVRYGGWGMQLIRALCDEVIWSHSVPSGTTVQVTKWIHRN